MELHNLDSITDKLVDDGMIEKINIESEAEYYTIAELGNIIQFLCKRACRSNNSKRRRKDFNDANIYASMIHEAIKVFQKDCEHGGKYDTQRN